MKAQKYDFSRLILSLAGQLVLLFYIKLLDFLDKYKKITKNQDIKKMNGSIYKDWSTILCTNFSCFNITKNIKGQGEEKAFTLTIFNILTIFLLYLEMVLCISLNLISIISIFYRKVATSIDVLVINLAIADILYSCGIPFYLRQFSDPKSFSQTIFGCRLSFIFDVTSMIVSFFKNFFSYHKLVPIRASYRIRLF